MEWIVQPPSYYIDGDIIKFSVKIPERIGMVYIKLVYSYDNHNGVWFDVIKEYNANFSDDIYTFECVMESLHDIIKYTRPRDKRKFSHNARITEEPRFMIMVGDEIISRKFKIFKNKSEKNIYYN